MNAELYKINPGIEFQRFDTSLSEQKYLAILEDDRYLQISEFIYLLCTALNGRRSLAEAKEILERELSREIKIEYLEDAVKNVLRPNGFIENVNGENYPTTKKKKKSYLLFEIQLLRPEWLKGMTELTKILFNKYVFYLCAVLIGLTHVGLYFFVEFDFAQIQKLSLTQFLILDAIYFFTVIFHEIGHASASFAYGARHKGIGLGIYIYYVVFFADVTDTWRLPQKQRAIVDVAGIYFHLIAASILFLIYLFIIPSDLLLLVIFAIDITIIFYLQPFLKFDGYWIFSDLLGVPNLHSKLPGMYKFIIDKYIRFKNETHSILNKLPGMRKKLLILYAISSPIFLVYFVFHLLSYVYKTLLSYPELLQSNMIKLTGHFNEGNYFSMINQGVGFLIINISLLLISVYAIIVIKRLFKLREGMA